ncbi:hypothetical protein ASPBRDRAFT_284425 [Aspergillus brasiliensis CBS 101740]|uniref:Uncharacterized protein n=1 Tax=Aspergillus brasiliensis (strain CBS 101740 / IMI 381727 / IBT 21946) TaxID=767769 RepID=A0A1L9UD97_ASPBC|nr:hypothetical protein ASPBRDRAFT_284425 [Aspergillus brasiliensis CBS 101740]
MLVRSRLQDAPTRGGQEPTNNQPEKSSCFPVHLESLRRHHHGQFSPQRFNLLVHPGQHRRRRLGSRYARTERSNRMMMQRHYYLTFPGRFFYPVGLFAPTQGKLSSSLFDPSNSFHAV